MHTRIPINFYLTTPNQSPQTKTRILKHLIHPPKSQESKQLGCIKLEMAPTASYLQKLDGSQTTTSQLFECVSLFDGAIFAPTPQKNN
jgi:hypothetical protein